MYLNVRLKRLLAWGLLFAFLANMLGPLPLAQAQELVLPNPGVRIGLSPEFTPANLKGITIHQDNALRFDFLVHKGDAALADDAKKEEYKKLIKYFLASLTIADKDQWVNLSPYEKDRIIEGNFGKTEMGRDLLGQDYLLKQITASLIYPEEGLGQKFWDRVYERAFKQYGTTNIPVNTFNKVWIVPDKAVVYESGNTAYILESHLKVMLEEDYLSKSQHTNTRASSVSSQVVREIVLPALEKEINEGKNFVQLRQIYSAMILATWYKKALKESLLGKVYADKAKVKGVDQSSAKGGSASGGNEAIYQQYLKAFKKGVYNYIKEDTDKYTHQAIPRKYFSGGFMNRADGAMTVLHQMDPAMRASVAGDLKNGVIDNAQVALGENTDVKRPLVEIFGIDPEDPLNGHLMSKVGTVSGMMNRATAGRTSQVTTVIGRVIVIIKEGVFMTIQTEYVVDQKGHKKSVLMSIRDYLKLVDYLEDLEDAVDLKKAGQTAKKFTDFDVLRAKYKKQGRIK